MTENTFKIRRERGRRREEEGRGGGEGSYDDKAVGGGLVDGVMCCFRANCLCDSGTASSIAIGYGRELMAAGANGAAGRGV